MKLINLIIGVLLLTGMAMADNVVVHVNYPDDVFYTGATNMIEIWIENSDSLQSISMGFEFSGYSGQVEWVLDYGPTASQPVLFEGPLSILYDIEVSETHSMDDSYLFDSLAVAGISFFANNLEPGGSRRCLSFLLKIPAGEPTGQICIDNVWLPPSVPWAFTNVNNPSPYAPNYNGCVNASTEDPDCPAVCFSVEAGTYLCGDVDLDGSQNVSDVTMMIADIFNFGPPVTNSIRAADVDCNGRFNLADPLYMIGFLFMGGYNVCSECP